jgi:TetR/AcrR family transcriptional regulator, regulator of autoinduction and epiphytic fitness
MKAVKSSPRPSGAPAPTRRERAHATRRRIIDAALARFQGPGYAATTMDTIAADAGVAVQTVYFAFHTKAELLLAALQVAGGEHGAPEEPIERAWFGQVMAATSGIRRLALIVEFGNEIYRRVSPLMPAVRAAALVDPGVDDAWQALERRRRDGMRQVIDMFARRGELRPGLDPSLALDLLFGVHRWETYEAFTEECGWPIERYKAWQFATLARQLLPPETAAAPSGESSSDMAELSFTDELALFR